MRSTQSLLPLAALWLLATAALTAQSFPSGNAPPSLPIGFGSAVAVSGNEILVGRPGLVPGFPMPPSQTGAVLVFRRAAGGKWAQAASVTASGSTIKDGFGAAIAIDGKLMAVGAPGANENRGAVFVFERDGSGRWVERARLSAANPSKDDRLGRALALKGGVLLAGAPGHRENQGLVVVFRQGSGPSTWSQQGTLVGSSARLGERFGSAVALDRDRALVGAPGQVFRDSIAGRALVFRRNGDTWVKEAVLEVQGQAVRGLGAALLVDGDALHVSAPGADSAAGVVFQFRRAESGSWQQVGRVAPASRDHPGLFGLALARDGQDLLVGAPFSKAGVGGIHVFRRDGSGWRETQSLTTKGVGLSTQLGASLAASGGIAAAGAPMADFFEGAVLIYERAGTGGQWRPTGTAIDSNTGGLAASTGGEVRCETGKARGFECRDADLISFLPVSAIGGKRGVMVNDIWGWTDSTSNREFALVGRVDGTSFVEVTDPAKPVYLGNLPLTDGAKPNLWRDIKVYKNHAFIVADGAGPHGMQVFDLTQLRDVPNAPATFQPTALYDRIHSAHNIVINEGTGFAYPVGNSMGGETCGGALHMIDIRDPASPKFAGCYADPATGKARTGYTHDAQCVVYHGPDEQYKGREICFNSSETALGIADVTDKENPKPISVATYPNVAYAHQGWLTDDHRYFYLDDEGDELAGTASRTRTLVFDLGDLDDPVVAKEFFGTTPATDHNLYVRGRYMYQSNYVSGLRVIDVKDPINPVEVGFFDTVPYGENQAGFAGSWSNFPYFRSGVVAVTSMREGLFMVRYRPQTLVP
ncbi:MAG TPA: choice-of-anchor B family protein [Gemmatimonadales bacterium]|nr:choice-of-anchor B family protein [Gemmatimonadales bacterium]